jgi:hypothetical protein
LFKYARRTDVARACAGGELAAVVDALIALVRLRSGALPDDVAIVLCRERAPGAPHRQ